MVNSGKLLAGSIALGIATAVMGTLLHRFALNWIFPVGLIFAFVQLFAGGIFLRAWKGTISVCIYAITVGLTTYFLSKVGSGVSYLVLGGAIEGEKSIAMFAGFIWVYGSSVTGLLALTMPQKWFEVKSKVYRLPTLTKDVDFMHTLADLADIITLKGFNERKFDIETKADGSPVTVIDRETEQAIRAAIISRYPSDIIYGEEFGSSDIPPETIAKTRRWVIDPIDATKNFIRGVPIWATLIALEENGEVIASIVSAPAMNARWYAAKGLGAWKTQCVSPKPPKRLHTSSITDLSKASLSISSLSGWQERGELDWLIDLTQQVARTRGFGDFYHYMLLAEGAVDIATEPELEHYDIAAPSLIVTEAGGKVTPKLDGAYATNGKL